MAYQNQKVEELLKSPITKEFERADWLELIIAAADQAGASADDQRIIRKEIEELLPNLIYPLRVINKNNKTTLDK